MGYLGVAQQFVKGLYPDYSPASAADDSKP